MSANIRVASDSSRVIVEARSAPASVWSFLDSYASIVGLGNRVERFTLIDEDGNEIQPRKIAPGQFNSLKPAARFRYEVSLKPPLMAPDSAMVSWINNERGLLMLADLLPLSFRRDGNSSNTIIRFTLPQQWRVYSSEIAKGQNEFEVHDVGQAVFAVGSQLRTSQLNESGMLFNLVTDGEWAFSDREALELAGKVLKAHREVFGTMPAGQASLILFPFPQAVGPNQWSAETRRSTVTVLMGKLPSKVGALALLSTPVTHEFFHLWVPNALALDGDYDWFYEGFTVYQAAQTAAQLGMLTFPEFLNSIARAYDASKAEAGKWSLVEASTRRFTIGRTSVYSKSQVVAFLYDLKLRSLSRNKKSLTDVYRRLIREHPAMGDNSRAGKTNDGTDVVTRELSAEIGSEDFVRTFIRGPVSIDLPAELAPFGLKAETVGLRTRIAVDEKIGKQQRDLLRQLGYNDATRGLRSK
jgi:predicted metalloprotease with PDZ domain